MKKVSVLVLFACANAIFAMLLIHKQNKIIKLLYELQQLQEQKDNLQQEKKDLIFQLHKEQQLSQVQTFAQQNLQMSPIKIKDAKKVSVRKELYESL